LDPKKPIIALPPCGTNRCEEMIRNLSKIGYDNVIGCFGCESMISDQEHEAADVFRTTPRISILDLKSKLDAADPPILIDVRNKSERASGYIEGSINVPLTRLDEAMTRIPKNKPCVVFCNGGYRSSVACSVLEAGGFTNVTDTSGGMEEWIANGLPVVKD
ncbi:MAG: rhodanese-like domain-containing protein, partial [Thermoguttaceae bacterium]